MVPADIINAKSQGQSKLVVCSWCTIKVFFMNRDVQMII